MIAYINFMHFSNREILRPDNFTEWYIRLRTSLQQYDALYMILEPLGPPPGEDLAQNEDDAFCDRRDCYTIAQTAIFSMMDLEMRGFWETTDSNEIISDMEEIFEPQVRLMKHDCLDEFLSGKMEEHTSVGMHLAKMHKVHSRLTVELEYEMTDAFAKSMELRSLRLSYRDFVERFVKRNEAKKIINSWEESELTK
jgi:hypothetical protein